MSEIVKDIAKGLPWYQYVVLAVSLGLGVAGFIIPPVGKIDPSVLTFTAEIIGGAWLFNFGVNIPRYIEAGASVKVSKGDASAEITTK